MSEACSKCYWFSMENPKDYIGVCRNPNVQFFVSGTSCCELFENSYKKLKEVEK